MGFDELILLFIPQSFSFTLNRGLQASIDHGAPATFFYQVLDRTLDH